MTDDGVVSSVHVKISDKNGVVLGNETMNYNSSSDKWEMTLTLNSAGGYSLIVWAKDETGNFGWGPGTMNIINAVSKGNIKGKIVDAFGNPISGVTLKLKDDKGTVVAIYVTGDDGTYTLKDIQPGTYTIVITKPGFETETTEEVTVGLGETSDIGSTILVPNALEPQNDDGNLLLWLILISAIAMLSLIMIALYRRRKKKRET
jgi:hypothetical protein